MIFLGRNNWQSRPGMRGLLYLNLWEGRVGAWCPSIGATGDLLVDFSGYGNHGTLTNFNLSTAWEPSVGGLSLLHDATDDRTIVTSSLVGNNLVTLNVWFHLSTTSLTGAFIKIGGDDATGYAIGVGSPYFESAGNNLLLLYENLAWFNGGAIGTGWHMASLVLNGSGFLYLDGNLVLTVGGLPLSPSNSINIGGYTTGPNRFFSDRLDDVFVANRPFQESGIKQLYTLGRAGSYAIDPQYGLGGVAGFKAYWARRQQQIIGGGVC
jgi:hypothetical protein